MVSKIYIVSGEEPLALTFPFLFSLAVNEAMVADVWDPVGEEGWVVPLFL